MHKIKNKLTGMTRRDFMKVMAVLGAAGSAPGLLQSCGSSSGSSSTFEKITLYFDHSHFEFERYDFYLNIGKKQIKLERITKDALAKARQDNNFLKAVPDQNITHLSVDVELPANSVQMCYVKYVPKGQSSTSPWKIALQFLHIPRSSIERSFKNRTIKSETSAKSRLYGGNYKSSSVSDVVNESMLINVASSASSIVFSYPEVLSLDSDSAAHIVTNIINTQGSTLTFASAIQAQGEDWASYQTLTNPKTGKPFTDSKGNTVQIPIYSEMTMQYGGPAINDSIHKVKNDSTLFANISKISDPSQMKGKICNIRNGVTYTDASPGALKNKKNKAGNFSYTVTDVCTGGGYDLKLDEVEADSNNIIAKFKCTNSYVRHLGMFVRYLDSTGKAIPLSSIDPAFFTKYKDYFFPSSNYDTMYDKCIKMIGAEYVVLGIPVHSMNEELEVPMPPLATKFQIIGNTLGHGDNTYNDLAVGIVLTAVFNLSVPFFFLVAGAAAGYGSFVELESPKMALEVLEAFIHIAQTLIEAFVFNDSKALNQLVLELTTQFSVLIAEGITSFIIYLMACIAEGEAIEALEAAIPFVGLAFSAISCLMVLSNLAQTSAEILLSPWNYVKTLSFSHDISLTINHDPKNPEGFPSTATYYVVTATAKMIDKEGNVVDSSTPIQITQQMPATTRTAPITVKITDVPYGGYIALTVGFYSSTNWLAGYGQLSDGDNSQESFSITITQNQVPLLSTTYYTHKEKITLDSSGNHIWTATTVPPVPTPIGQCGTAAGQLCQIVGITDSNTFASVGYTWQAANSGTGQQFYFGNVSTTDTPQSSSIVSTALQAQPRVVYELMGDAVTQRNFYLDVQSGNIIRQIRLSLQGKPTYDGPNSNKAWGRLNFSSDSMLLHPNGKIVSINEALSKIEVLTLPTKATNDADAPLAAVYAGQGIREGLLDGPLCAALTPKGEILILETRNDRIQAFDTGGNPVEIFSNKTAYFTPLKYSASQYKYLDMAVEYTGYIYLLCYMQQDNKYSYFLDIYTPEGAFLSRTSNFSAAKIVVSYWRDVFAANMDVLKMPNGTMPAVTEPSISRWIPSTP